jgi:glyoxylase-like metal-dependent hydrolase (beta-lactamase superfamily II)
MEEVAAGIHRIESDLGPRLMAQYLLIGDERSVLVDTGVAGTPDAVLIPALERIDIEPDLIVISHADLDHCGGNRRMRERFPRALLACHERDRLWIESNAAMLAENYLWHEPYGLDEPNEAERREMLAEMGGDAPIDLGLRGGETIRIAAGRRLEVLHLPGHTDGHVGIWDPHARIAIIIDAALADGICDRMGNKLIPPRYYNAGALPPDDPPHPRARARAAAHGPLPSDGQSRGTRVLRPLACVRRCGRGDRARRARMRRNRPSPGHRAS